MNGTLLQQNSVRKAAGICLIYNMEQNFSEDKIKKKKQVPHLFVLGLIRRHALPIIMRIQTLSCKFQYLLYHHTNCDLSQLGSPYEWYTVLSTLLRQKKSLKQNKSLLFVIGPGQGKHHAAVLSLSHTSLATYTCGVLQ